MNNMEGLSTTTYLSRNQVDAMYGKLLTNEELAEKVFSGELIKKFSYYLPSEKLLRALKIIPNTVKVNTGLFGKLAKNMSFTRKEIQEIFDCSCDTVKLICEKYFYKKYNYFYKTEMMQELLAEGKEEYEI